MSEAYIDKLQNLLSEKLTERDAITNEFQQIRDKLEMAEEDIKGIVEIINALEKQLNSAKEQEALVPRKSTDESSEALIVLIPAEHKGLAEILASTIELHAGCGGIMVKIIKCNYNTLVDMTKNPSLDNKNENRA